jgi:DNA-3-methyladenine glycosylase I
LSKELKRLGWTFVGPTTCYALMQAMGMVNDHMKSCHTWAKVDSARRQFHRPQ